MERHLVLPPPSFLAPKNRLWEYFVVAFNAFHYMDFSSLFVQSTEAAAMHYGPFGNKKVRKILANLGYDKMIFFKI